MLQFPTWKRVLIWGLCALGILLALPNAFYSRVEGHNDAVAAIEAGQPVREMLIGNPQPGVLKCAWDGMNDSGEYVPEGPYQVRVSSKQGDNEVELQTELLANVESVNMSARDGLTLNLQGIGPVAFNDVKQIF